MKLASILSAALIAALALAGCSSRGTDIVPGAQTSQSATSRHEADRSIEISASIPAAPSHLPKVVAIGVELDADATTFTAFDVQRAAPCAEAADKSIECKIVIPAAAGYHRLVVTGYKDPLDGGRPAAGSGVSANTIPVNLVNDHAEVHLAFYSLTERIWVRGLDARITGRQEGGFTVDRSTNAAPAPFSLTTLDAKQRFVVGPASPGFDVLSSSSDFELKQPSHNELIVATAHLAQAGSAQLHLTIRGKSSPLCPDRCRVSFQISVTAKQ
jgi:hypothetical protein